MSWTNNRKRFLCDYFPLKHFQKDREALIILMTQAESTKTVKLAATPVELMSPWFCNNCCIILQHKIQLAYVRHSCVPALGPAPESQKPTGLSVSQLGGRQTGSQQSVAWCEHAELVGNGNRSGFSRRSRGWRQHTFSCCDLMRLPFLPPVYLAQSRARLVYWTDWNKEGVVLGLWGNS